MHNPSEPFDFNMHMPHENRNACNDAVFCNTAEPEAQKLVTASSKGANIVTPEAEYLLPRTPLPASGGDLSLEIESLFAHDTPNPILGGALRASKFILEECDCRNSSTRMTTPGVPESWPWCNPDALESDGFNRHVVLDDYGKGRVQKTKDNS